MSHGMDRLQNGLSYGPTNLDNRMSKNIQNIKQGHKLHYKSHEKLESGIDSRRTNSRKGKNPKRNLQENSLLLLLFVKARIPFNYILRKSQDKPSYVYDVSQK